MRNLLLASLTLPTLLLSGGASAATVGWRAGETTPPTEITPMSPTPIDTVSFTAATPPFFFRFGNSCEAVRELGSPMISTNTAAREFSVEFTPKPDPTVACPLYYDPVNGIEGDLGKLDPGSWTLIITNVNDPLMNATLPFTVTSVATVSGELILHTLANDQVTGRTFPFDSPFFIARPLGHRCNSGNGGTICGGATLQQGAPLTGITAIQTPVETPLPSFTLPRSALNVSATGSIPPLRPYRYISTHASNVHNGAGFFAPGGGPGKRTVTFPASGEPGARVAISPGANQFGGTMRLLGAMGSKRAHEYQNKTFVGTGLSSFGALGTECTITCYVSGAQSNFQYHRYQTTMGKATTASITTLGLPWTTGVVSITATAGPFPTLFRRSGYDNRTAKGLGTIQLVAPQLVRWEFPERDAPWDRHTGAIGILRIKFVPEPSGWVVLVAGLGVLAVLYRLRTRRYRSSSAARRVD